MSQLAHIFRRLEAESTSTLTLQLMGRHVTIKAADPTLLPAFQLPEFVWEEGDDSRATTDLCVVTTSRTLGLRDLFASAAPSRVLDHAAMGIFSVYDLPDGVVAVQEGRGAFVQMHDGNLILAADDALLAGDGERLPNLGDLGNVLTSTVLARAGYLLVHAGAVGKDGRCRLFTGASGSGKTTLTLRMVSRGCDFYGDDMIIVGRRDGRWTAWPFWRTVNITPATCRMLPELHVFADTFTETGKRKCEITDLFPVKSPPPAPIEAVYSVGRDGPEAPQPLSLAETLSILGQTFLTGLTADEVVANFDQLMAFVDDIPVYRSSWNMEP